MLTRLPGPKTAVVSPPLATGRASHRTYSFLQCEGEGKLSLGVGNEGQG